MDPTELDTKIQALVDSPWKEDSKVQIVIHPPAPRASVPPTSQRGKVARTGAALAALLAALGAVWQAFHDLMR